MKQILETVSKRINRKHISPLFVVPGLSCSLTLGDVIHLNDVNAVYMLFTPKFTSLAPDFPELWIQPSNYLQYLNGISHFTCSKHNS